MSPLEALRTRSESERSRGQVIAEFVLVIPLFMLITLGIAEGGYYVAATTMVNSATHEGARLGVLETTASRDTVRSRVQSAASPIVSIAGDAIDLRLAKANGDGTWQAAGDCDDACYAARQKDDLLIVSTTYGHTPLVGYIFPGITFPSSASAELTVEGDAV